MGLIEKHLSENSLEIAYVGDSPEMPSLDQVTSDIEKMPKLKAKQVKTALEKEFQRGVSFPLGYAKVKELSMLFIMDLLFL